MITLNNENKNKIYAFIPSIKNSLSEWQIISFRFKSEITQQNESVFKNIVKIYEDNEGFYFMDTPKKGVVIVRLGRIENYTIVKKQLETKLEKYKCHVLIRKMSDNGLKNLEINLSEDGEGPITSALYSRREERDENVVLVVDDDEFIRTTIKTLLAKHATVFEAEDGENVIDLYTEKNPDVVILDIHMPKKDGLTLVTELQDLDSDAFILMSSSDAVQKTILEAISRGAVGFIAKPFSKEKILDYVRQCITFRKPKK